MSPLTRFTAASGLTNFADGIATLAWAWLASLLTRDPLWIATVVIALRLPWLLFAIPAGIITDRVDRRVLILRMDGLRVAAFAVAAFCIWLALPLAEPATHGITEVKLFVLIICVALAVGIAEVFRDNAAQTLLPSIVDHDSLEKANGQLWSAELIGGNLLGPSCGAFLIAAATPLPFAANAIVFLVAFGLIYRLTGNFKPPAAQIRDWRTEFHDGFQFLCRNALLRNLAWITGLWNLFYQMVMIALVLHVQENLGLDAPIYGLILAAGAIGGIAGALSGEKIMQRLGPARTCQWMLTGSVVAFVCIAAAPGPVTLAAVICLFEFTGLVWNVVSVSYRQRAIPNALLGRVNSLYRLLAWGMIPVGLLLSGLTVQISELFLSREGALIVPFLVAAIGTLILTLVGWKPLTAGFAERP